MNNWKRLSWTTKLWVIGVLINMVASAFVIWAIIHMAR